MLILLSEFAITKYSWLKTMQLLFFDKFIKHELRFQHCRFLLQDDISRILTINCDNLLETILSEVLFPFVETCEFVEVLP